MEPPTRQSETDRGDVATEIDEPPRQPTVTHLTTPPVPPASREDTWPEPDTMVGEYRIEHEIGRGGMGVVYSAVHPMIGKRAAIKVLKSELCREQFAIERFLDEARVVNAIRHPNIVDAFAFGTTPGGRSYIVMEWLSGETLRQRIRRSALDLDDVAAVMAPLCRALAAAHDCGVIHRDLKPDNVFLVEVRGQPPLVKLLDFGIAKLARDEHRVEKTAIGVMVGTPQYISPEQARGYAIDARADVYSLGALAFELLTGRPPFIADNPMEMIEKHLMEPPPHPSAFTRGISHELDELVVAMLAKDPALRPSLAEISTVFETCANRRTTVHSAPDPVTIGIPITRPRRKRVGLLALGILGAGTLGFAAVRFISTDDAVLPPDPAVVTPPLTPPTPSVPAPPPLSPPSPQGPGSNPAAVGVVKVRPDRVTNGKLVVVVSGMGYRLFVDQESVRSPHSLEPGTHSVIVRAPGMQDWSTEVTIIKGQTVTLRPKLRPRTSHDIGGTELIPPQHR